jgi:hypothetical protein
MKTPTKPQSGAKAPAQSQFPQAFLRALNSLPIPKRPPVVNKWLTAINQWDKNRANAASS